MVENALRNAAINLMSKSMAVAELIMDRKSMEDYGRRLRGLVRGLWNGTLDSFAFVDSVREALERAFNQAWVEGARSQGIEPGERTPEEQARLDQLIYEQSGYIPGLADWVNAHLKVDKFKLAEAQARIPMWTNRYREVMNTAKTMAGADKKLVWVLGPTEHCSSCLKLAGKVKRGSVWMASGIQPQSPALACGGFFCQCSLQPTDLPASPGRLPSIP